MNKKYYDTPEFEFVRFSIANQLLTTVSGEGDPNQIVVGEDGDNLN